MTRGRRRLRLKRADPASIVWVSLFTLMKTLLVLSTPSVLVLLSASVSCHAELPAVVPSLAPMPKRAWVAAVVDAVF